MIAAITNAAFVIVDEISDAEPPNPKLWNITGA